LQSTFDTADFSTSVLDGSRKDRLGITLFGSALAHVVLLLAVGFVSPNILPDIEQLPTLDIVLVNSRTKDAPDDVQFLAQANQDGGGESDESSRPSTPLPLSTGSTGKPQRAQEQMQTGTVQSPSVSAPDVLRADISEDALTDPLPSQSETVVTEDDPADALLTERNQLTAELSQFWQEYQKRPRRKFLSARTREYQYAEYMEKWRSKVETVGNVNYPPEARRQKLSGSLVLDVSLNPDGSINNISLERSSGNRILDNAAMDIVRIASPFDPFPANIQKDIDILHITRTWEFSQSNTLSSH